MQGEPSIQGNQTGPVFESPAIGSPGEIIDANIEPPDRPLVDPEKPQRETIATGPPKADEWLDFFSRIVLKVGMELYTDFAFRGVDESKVSEADLRRIAIKREERDSIARPFAEFATKNPYMRKHGRQVVALTDSAESLMTLGIWMRRVNRVAKRYRPQAPKTQRPQNLRIRETNNVGNGQDQGTGFVEGTTNGKVPGGFGIYNPGGG